MTIANPIQIPEVDWADDPLGVFVVCPECRTTLRLNHDVAADGTITPSIGCPACQFHDRGVLVGWTRRAEASDTEPTKGE